VKDDSSSMWMNDEWMKEIIFWMIKDVFLLFMWMMIIMTHEVMNAISAAND
jgi:hypothetical protein